MHYAVTTVTDGNEVPRDIERTPRRIVDVMNLGRWRHATLLADASRALHDELANGLE